MELQISEEALTVAYSNKLRGDININMHDEYIKNQIKEYSRIIDIKTDIWRKVNGDQSILNYIKEHVKLQNQFDEEKEYANWSSVLTYYSYKNNLHYLRYCGDGNTNDKCYFVSNKNFWFEYHVYKNNVVNNIWNSVCQGLQIKIMKHTYNQIVMNVDEYKKTEFSKIDEKKVIAISDQTINNKLNAKIAQLEKENEESNNSIKFLAKEMELSFHIRDKIIKEIKQSNEKIRDENSKLKIRKSILDQKIEKLNDELRYQEIRNNKLEKAFIEMRNKIPVLPQNNDTNDCCICFEAIKSQVACVPCGHTQFCEKCIKKCKICPLCKQPFASVLKLFK